MSKLVKWYKNLNTILKASFWFTLSSFMQKGINMLTTPVFTRLLSTEEFGKINTYMSWAEILFVLISLSTWRGMLNLYKKDQDKERVFFSIVGLTCFISVIFSFFILIVYKIVGGLFNYPLWIVLSLLLFAFSYNILLAWNIRMQYEYIYKPSIIVSMIYTGVSAIGGVLAIIYINKSATAKLFPQISINIIIAVIIIFYYARKKLKWIDFKNWKFCLSFSIPLIPHYLSEVVLNSSDRIMIDELCSSSDVALYSMAYAVGSLSLILTGAINSTFAPYQYQKITQKKYKDLAKNTNIIIFFVAIAIIFLMMFGKEVVIIFGGKKYIESISLIIPICIGVYFNYIFQLFARVQEYYEQKYTIVIASVSCAILNILLNYIFIPRFGYFCAAYTTAISYFVFCLIHYFFYRLVCKKHQIGGIYDVKTLAIISAILIAASVIIIYINKVGYIKYIILILSAIILFLKRKIVVGFINNMRGD